MNRKEQLIYKSKERYGELKTGDLIYIDSNRLGFTMVRKDIIPINNDETGFAYVEENDSLYFGNTMIYSRGVWGELIEKPKNVKASYSTIYQKGKKLYMEFHLSTELPINKKGLSDFIIQKIEELNKNDEQTTEEGF